jgi:hypothetical protein
LTLLCGTVFLVVGLNWWFRRGDKRICSQLAVTRENRFVDPSERLSERGSDPLDGREKSTKTADLRGSDSFSDSL